MKNIIINYPEDYIRTISPEEENNEIISKDLIQEILDYLLAKLSSFSLCIKSVFKSDILSSYKVYCGRDIDLFISMRSIYKENSEYNWVCVQYFDNPCSKSYADSTAFRLRKIKFDNEFLFNQVIVKNEDNIPNNIPNIIVSFCFNKYGIGFYNIDKDLFITKITESVLYGIMDQIDFINQQINLKEFSD